MTRSIGTIAALPFVGHAMNASAECESVDESISQLRLIERQSGEPAMRSTVAAAGFPAIAQNGGEVAVLRSLDAAQRSVVLDVMRSEGGEVLQRFTLFPEDEIGSPFSEAVRVLLSPTEN